MRTPWILAAAGALALAGTGVAIATGGPSDEPAAAGDAGVLLQRLYAGSTVEQFVAQLASTLRAADRAGDGLDAGDVDLARRRDAARARGASVGEALAYDLDGDLRVTRAEVARGAETPDLDEGPGRAVEAMMTRFDGDGDGVVTVAEAAAVTRGGSREQTELLVELVALDPSGDGRLTARELRTLAERVFAGVDRDGDGVVSAPEYQAIAPRVQAARAASLAPSCAMPPVAAGTTLVAFGAYEGHAIASAAVGGPDEETNLIDVAVEPGRTPLYLVLTSYESMIWRVSGATERVQRVVVSSTQTATAAPGRANRAVVAPVGYGEGGPSASGVIGVQAARVTITNGGCPRYFSSLPAAEATATIRRSAGRAPDAVFATYSTARVALPSGTISPRDGRERAAVPAGFDGATWSDAVRYWPAGLVRVDPRAVVARVRVAPYQVLPSQMGLAPLVGSGAAVRTGGDTFRIVRPIAHMPPSMGGAHSATLIFARGVPVPPGDPVHSCIVREETGAQAGAACRNGR